MLIGYGYVCCAYQKLQGAKRNGRDPNGILQQRLLPDEDVILSTDPSDLESEVSNMRAM